MSRSDMIEEVMLPVGVNRPVETQPGAGQLRTIHENERDYILKVLKSCNGKIWGAGAAAEVLNLPPSTLKSRMKKLGITRQYPD